MRFIHSVALIGRYTALSRLFGLVREILMSHLLGAGALSDAFVVAFKFPNFFRRIFAEGAFNAAFVPVFSGELIEKGPKSATDIAEAVFSFMTAVLVGFVLLVLTLTPYLIHYVLAPGFATTPERLELAVDFTRITFPYILFISLTALLGGVLNSFDRFSAAAAAPILLNVCMITALLSSAFFSFNPGYSLSWSVLIAGFLQLLWLYLACKKHQIALKIRVPQLTPPVKLILKKMGPGIISAGVMQVNIFVDMWLASWLPQGSISYLYYADRLNQLPLSIFGTAIGTALLPLLSKQLRAGERGKALRSQDLAVGFALQLTLPSAISLILLATPLIALIYGHGKFQAQEISETAAALAAFVVGLPAYVLSKIFITPFFARGDTSTPMRIALVSVCANIILNLILMQGFAHVGMALATALSAWINAGMLLYKLRQKKLFILTRTLQKMVGKLLLACGMMAGGIEGSRYFLKSFFREGLLGELAFVTLLLCIGGLVFALAASLLGAINFSSWKRMLRGKE